MKRLVDREYYDGDVNLPAFLTAKNLKPFIYNELYVTSSMHWTCYSSTNEMKITIKKEPTDPLALRASIGGNEKVGYYCVYRGDIQAIRLMLARVLDEILKEPMG